LRGASSTSSAVERWPGGSASAKHNNALSQHMGLIY
jgi:hypothetical protein